MNGQNINTRPCSPRSLCNRFRECPRCARIRQAKIANAVEKLNELCGDLDWTILYPGVADPNAAIKAKIAFLKKAMPTGAIWTVEHSQKNGNYHINLITPAGQVADIRQATRWTNRIEGDVRAVGAYISKTSQMPTAKQYPGKLFGTAGNLWQILSQAQEFPVVQAAAAQYAIDSMAMIDEANRQYHKAKDEPKVWWSPEKEKPPLSREEAREISARWLPDILEAQRARNKQK